MERLCLAAFVYALLPSFSIVAFQKFPRTHLSGLAVAVTTVLGLLVELFPPFHGYMSSPNSHAAYDFSRL